MPASAIASGSVDFVMANRFPFPCLVLLDLKLPVKMGLDVLRWVRSQRQLQNLLVLVLTSSSSVRDVDEAYQVGRPSVRGYHQAWAQENPSDLTTKNTEKENYSRLLRKFFSCL
jgi:CheY-like chemotaxis protein